MPPIFDTVSAIVPIRKGSQRIPGKNLRSFASVGGQDHSLLTWKINQLAEVLPVAHIIVSSDWPEALELAAARGATVHQREPRLAGADAPFEELIALMAEQVRTEHMMWTPVTSPFIGPSVLRRFLDRYLSLNPSERADGLIAVTELRNYFFMANRPLNFQVGGRHVQTQEIPPVSLFDWGLAARPVLDVRASKYMFAATPTFFDIDLLANFDINEETEFVMAQALVELYLAREKAAADA